jgi:hypothetical protein
MQILLFVACGKRQKINGGNMIEPSIWMQLGISDDRYAIISKEISSILKTGEKTGIMMEMVKDSRTMSNDEKLYAAFMVAKSDIERKLFNSMPAFGKGLVKNILEK